MKLVGYGDFVVVEVGGRHCENATIIQSHTQHRVLPILAVSSRGAKQSKNMVVEQDLQFI